MANLQLMRVGVKLAAIERMALEGVREMQFLLGFLKENGLGCDADIAGARDWYCSSAERGFAPAQHMLFCLKNSGERRSNDQNAEQATTAVDCLRKAAAAGYAPAQVRLSEEASDPTEAHDLLFAAAEQGYARGAFLLGCLYRDGKVGSKSDHLATAFFWFRRAAELGDADSAAIVAGMLREGQGVEKDEAAALKWFLKAFEMNSPSAAIALSQIYRFGMLGQEVDLRRSKTYSARVKRLRTWWAQSLGLPDKKRTPPLRALLRSINRKLW
jgi:hypothetical protein